MKLLTLGFLTFLALLGSLEAYQLATDSTAFTSSVANIAFRNNLHEVVPGRFYRSAEMSRAELRRSVREHNIRTVIDLRLSTKKSGVGRKSERRVLERLGVHYIRAPLRSSRPPERAEVEQLIQSFKEIPTPVLVHCSSGTHRSGFVSALWLLTQEGKSFSEASAQLSLKYGFVRLERMLKAFTQGHPTLDDMLWDFGRANDETGVDFETWMKVAEITRRGRRSDFE